MNIAPLISDLAQQDIRLWLEDGNLRYSAPDGAMTAEVIAKLREHKQQIISFLQQSEQQQRIELPKADRGDGSIALDVSPAQQRLWFLQQLEPDNSAYHIHAALRLKGSLNIASLNHACSEIIARHEILHTCYILQDGIVKQQIGQPFQITLEAIAASEADIPQHLQAHLHKPFNLSVGVFRCQLWQINNDEYIIAFTVHHIAADGWSLGLFVNELMALYQAHSQGQALQLPALEYQYADYAYWKNQQEQQDLQNQQLDYWREELSGCPNLNLPLDFKRQTLADNSAGTVDITLSNQATAALNAIAKRQGATLFMTLLASYAILLQRYSQQNDFAIGTPIAGRSLAQLEPMIGCFLNVLAIRCEVDGEQSFEQILATHIAQSKAAFSHQDIPFERIVNELVKNRDLSQSPIFQTMLSLQNTPFKQATELSDLAITPVEEGDISAQFDLKLTITEQESEQNLICRFEFKKSLFKPSTIKHMAAHFRRLIDLLCNAPSAAINTLDLFASDNMATRLQLQPGEANDTTKALPEKQLLHHLFEQQVQLTPNAPAVADKQHSLSYSELNTRANSIAKHLRTQGATSGQLIGVCLYRSVNMSAALLGILKAGCAYVPMDPDFPKQRLQFIAEDTAINFIISDAGTAANINEVTGAITNIELTESFYSANLHLENLDISINNDAIFNVIYTSGSTGKPKGVMVPHRGICNRLLWMQEAYPLSAEDHILQKTPYSFDVSVWELFWPLIVGSRYYFADAEAHKDPLYLRDIIQQQAITTLHFVPSMLGAFLNSAEIESCSTVRQVFCSGEALQLEQQNRFMQRLPNSGLHNLYGPTEASIDVSYYNCIIDSAAASVPIGKAINNTQLHILDEQLRPLPKGIAGELYIGGLGLALGYLNRDDLTTSAFIDNPFASQGHPSKKLYKTGDLARIGDDDNIIYLGRLDHQVKVRGNRIELGEIEHAINEHLAVRESIVVAKDQGNNLGSILVAYYIPESNSASDNLKQDIAAKLPSSMQPAAFIALDEWPLTPSGKINRNKLPEPDWQALNQQVYVAPNTDTEKQIVAIWQEVLGLDKIGVEDNFFHIGGHSLTATQALAKAQEKYAVEVAVREIFENPTVRHIAALLDQAIMEQSVFDSNNSETEDDDDMETFVL